MVNRSSRDNARSDKTSNNPGIVSDSSYPPKPSVSRSGNFSNVSGIDEVIASLSNAHENRRARQVTEWELMSRQYVH